jgi:tripartite ATP-independent transporter DctP family solute receptor
LHYYDYNYSNNNIFILSFDILENNNIQKSFLDIKIFSQDGKPIDKAIIRIIESDILKNYILKINADGYHPYETNIQLKAGSINKINIKLTPDKFQSKKHFNNQLNKMQFNNSQEINDQEREMTLSLGMEAPKGSLLYIYAEKFAQEVCKLSDGKRIINIYTDKKLGADRQMLKYLLDDDQFQFMISNTSSQVDFIPKISVFDLPLVYMDINDLRNTLDNKAFFEKISDFHKDAGYKLLGIADLSFRQVTSNKEIRNSDDFKGIKIRVYQTKNFEEFWKSLGTIAVPLPISEIYDSLRHGLIDSQTNPYENIVALKLYEIQKYLINTNHMPYLISLITSDKFYNSLSLKEKSIIDEASLIATKYAREKADERIEESKEILMQNGMPIIDLSEETINEMRQMSIPAYERIINIVNDNDLINAYLKGNKDNG